MYKFRDSQKVLNCLICFEGTNQHFYCQKCSYLICQNCFDRYQRYKYDKCPQCREYLNKEITYWNRVVQSNLIQYYLPMIFVFFCFYYAGYKMTQQSSIFFILINIVLGSQMFLGGFIFLNLVYNPFLLSQFLFCIYYLLFFNT